ncbi:uncharacterized protein KY384_003736 [Bacidia gigantensis]|uniref:uncharacterized protein n=1 Tax=Bacidia gigantensis TaxID=2732470 RepID=UPI001D03B25E|nr:uncharacterized protein KY384_003736 [Bacidia gigantensis]KAG8532099.1 hypothetical protein KY384_003736 [Bacidia gigantensis]
MSALGSSVINKSNKKFAPKKAPIRRPGVPDSAEHSARPSEERQAQSQTPQLPSTLYPASPSPAPSRALLTSSRPDDALASHSVQAASAQDGNAIHLPLPSRLTSASREPSHSSIVPQKRPLARENHVTRPTSSYTKNSASADHPRPSTPTTHDALVRTNLQLTAKTAPSIERVTRSRRKETSRPSERIANNGPPTLHTRVSKRRKANEQRGERDETETGTARVDITTSSSEGLQNDSPAVATSTLPTKATSSSKLKRAPRKKSQKSAGSTSHNRLSAQALEDDENANEHQVAEPANQMKTQKRQKPKLSRRQKAIQDAAADIVEDAVRGTARTSKKGKTGHRRRPSTPDNAENVTIAPEEMKMIELCQDSHTGRKSLREQELREMDRAAFVKQKQRELQDMMGHAASPENDGFAAPSRDQETRQERQRGQERQVALNVPNTVIIDGQIQIDEDSLRIDRHAAAAVERDLEDLPQLMRMT